MKYIKKSIKEYQSIDKVILVLFFASIIALPSNLAKTWQPAFSYYQGIFIEYWAPKIFVSQILIILVFLLTLFAENRNKTSLYAFFTSTFSKAQNRLFSSTSHRFIIIFMMFLLGKSLFVQHPERFLTWLLPALVGPATLFITIKKDRFIRYLPYAVLTSTTLQAFIGSCQYLLQKNLLPYQFLGETQFHSMLFLAKSTFLETSTILPYGTTPHPNILGGWLVIGIAALYLLRKKIDAKMYYAILTIHLIPLYLTESFSAWASLPIMALFFMRMNRLQRSIKVILVLVSALVWTALPVVLEKNWLTIPVPESISRRSEPIKHLLNDIPDTIWLGSGLGQAFPTLNSSENQAALWKYAQPLHNSGIILLYELGICAFLLFFIFIIFDKNNYSLNFFTILFILPIFYLDHYLTTHILGQYFIVLLALFFVYNSDIEKA